MCKASGCTHGEYQYGLCTHGSALLQVIQNLIRPEELTLPEAVIPTARLCRWNVPTVGEMFSGNQPAWFIPFEKASNKRAKVVHDGTGGTTRNRRVVFSIQPSIGRSGLVVLAPAMAATNKRDTPAKTTARRAFYGCLKRSHERIEPGGP